MKTTVASSKALCFTWLAEHHLKAAELEVEIDTYEVYLAVKALCDVDEDLPKSQRRFDEAKKRINAFLKQKEDALDIISKAKNRQVS